MKKVLIGTIFLGLASLGYSQSSEYNKNGTKLSEIDKNPTNRVYFDMVSEEDSSSKVYILEKEASRYNIREHPFFNMGSHGRYRVGFYKGKGEIEATFGRNGKILYARENYRDLKLPTAVRDSIYQKYSDWVLGSTAYTVFYNGKTVRKTYTVQIGKDGMNKKLKLDIYGNIKQ